MTKTIAVLLTCHNRKEKTLTCLQRLFEQVLPPACILSVYLVDDGSTDGTAHAVSAMYPDVTIMKGDGTLFWCAGMRLAWEYAAQDEAEFYLWLNDDTFLRPNCLSSLLAVWNEEAEKSEGTCIVVGSCCDPDTGEHSYGGTVSGVHPARLAPVLPDPRTTKTCDTFNGNCILVSKAVFNALGPMRRFQHAMADTDYGLRATRSGIPIIVAPGYVAECSPNPPECSWTCRTLTRRERWRNLVSRKGLPPRDWWNLLWEHAGPRAFLYWPVPYLRVLVGL